MSVLSKEELDTVMKVQTSAEFANTLLKRNKGLLDFLDTLPQTEEECEKSDQLVFTFDSSIGCPHCQYHKTRRFLCNECAWNAARVDLDTWDFYCIEARFGGVSHEEVCYQDYVRVEYFANEEHVYADLPDAPVEYPDYLKELEKCKKFVRGHIEWAEEVLRRTESKV